VPLIAAAVCPHPPLLLPELAGAAASELDGLRAACDAALRHLASAGPDRVVAVGSAAPPSAAELGRPEAPLSLAVADWLLDRAGLSAEKDTVSAATPAAICAERGAGIVGAADRVGLLVMGDGSACRGPKAPGYDDPDAAPFDGAVAAALAGADPVGLLALDADRAARLLCAGRAPWQVLAGAVAADGRAWHGELLYDAAPYGVAYFVATWSPR
jgi:hypothetical protein